MKNLDEEKILDVYRKALKYKLDKAFIDILEKELKSRNENHERRDRQCIKKEAFSKK